MCSSQNQLDDNVLKVFARQTEQLRMINKNAKAH
jgi:hypothetical protein